MGRGWKRGSVHVQEGARGLERQAGFTGAEVGPTGSRVAGWIKRTRNLPMTSVTSSASRGPCHCRH